ncbi:hypothetical protein [Rhizomonospora bruguierae]|uniref:hypothetical protein n=1 Tax=Rhizomonospora bruguierae TaxID=1581705 RepID=UPI001BCE3593|nr:hypothetical protein [Micromonospora sp. NBRC 107566]
MHAALRLRLCCFVLAAAAAAVLLLGGCAEHSFDPSTARPCEFFTADELREFDMHVQADEPDLCWFGHPLGTQYTLVAVAVEYRDGDPASVAADLKLAPVDGELAKKTTATFLGSINVKDKQGSCVLVAPMGEGHSLLVRIDTDTRRVHWFSVGPFDDPCEYVASGVDDKATKIEAKLRRA